MAVVLVAARPLYETEITRVTFKFDHNQLAAMGVTLPFGPLFENEAIDWVEDKLIPIIGREHADIRMMLEHTRIRALSCTPA